MQSDNYLKLEKVLMKIAFIPLKHLIDLSVSDYNILNRSTGSEIVTVAYNNGINLHQLCRNEMEIVNFHNAKKKDKIIRKVKALKAKLKATPSNQRSTVHQSRAQEPIAVNMAPNNVVENLVASHFEQESSVARNVNIPQDEFPEFLSRDSAFENISNESIYNSISLPMNQIPVPFPIEANLSDNNSIDNMNPPRVEVYYEEAVLPRPELLTPDADDFGNADFEDIQSLGFDQNVMSSFRDDRPTNDQSAEILHHVSDIQPRSSMREGVPITQTLFGDSFQPNAEMSIAHQSMLNSTQLSPRNYAMFEKSSTALPDYSRTPVALAASSFIITPFSGIEYGDSVSSTYNPQSEDTISMSSTSSRRMLIFNNIQETIPVQAHTQHRRRRAQRAHDYFPDILNSLDDIMIINSILVIPESIMKNPHNNPRMFKTPSFIDPDLTFVFDLLKISRETPNVLSQSNLPIVNSFDEIVPFNFFDNDLQQRPSIAITDFDSIQPRPSTTLTDYDSVQPRPSTLPTNYKLQQRPTEVTPANEKLQQRPTEVTPANDNIAGNISEILAQSVTVNDPVEEQTYLDERTPLQKRVVAPANIIPTTSIYETYDIPDNVRQMPMNTTDGIIDITPHVQHFDVNQRDVSRISDLCEVAIPQHEEELIPTENNNRQRLLPNNNQLRNTSLQLMQPYKNIIHRGQKYIQFEDDLKFSVYFLKLTEQFYEIQQLFVENGVHRMDAEDVIYHLKNDEITVKCIKIRLLNLCQNNLIEIEDDAQRKIAYISILFLETTVEEDSPILII